MVHEFRRIRSKSGHPYALSRVNNVQSLAPFEKRVDSQISPDLPQKFRNEFKAVIVKNQSLFVTSRKDLRISKLPMLKLKLKEGCYPRMQRPYRMSELQLTATRETVKDLLEGGQASPSCSEIAAPTHLVMKKDKKWRMVVDYRLAYSSSKVF